MVHRECSSLSRSAFLALGVAFFSACHQASPTVDPPGVVSAATWGSQPWPFPPGYEHVPERIVIHHAGVVWTGEREPVETMRRLQSWCQRERGWRDVPYHFLIAPDGTVFEGRPLRYRPDSNTNFDTNGCINVEFFGDFEQQRVSSAQLESAARLIAWLRHSYDLNTTPLRSHADLAETVCPGRDLRRYLDEGLLDKWADRVQRGEPLRVVLLPPLPGGPEQVIGSSSSQGR